MTRRLNLLREIPIPLIAGVIAAMYWANLSPDTYNKFVYEPLFGGLSFHFISNELFMVLFFAIAAVEITQSCLPGGSLNPASKAINPLLGTLGGVVGPIAVYFIFNSFFGSSELTRGWGIPTATDIALAWLAARMAFGDRHPAVSYLLLLAVADDAIGLAIIAIFYPNPNLPTEPVWLLLTCLGMLVAYVLRNLKVQNYWYYLVLGGVLSWTGLHSAHLHPALALVFIVPFLPHSKWESKKIFEDDPADRSPMNQFEHEWKIVVDFGLFMFGLANAGVEFSSIGTVSWIVLAALVIGKTAGIFGFGWLATRLGFGMPRGMRRRELLVAGMIAGTGFTVALFVCGEAFTDIAIKGAAKMGAMFSIVAAITGVAMAKLLKIKRIS